jgi:hypothetical protein
MSNKSELKEYSLSDGDIRTVLGQNISIMTYPELKHISNIDDCFDDKGRCIILYLTESENSGHWTALLKNGNHIEFFDPYGDSPEGVRSEIPPDKRQQLDETRPYLQNLLKGSAYKVTHNRNPFQQDKAGINTCGRHCVVRLKHHDLDISQYKSLIKKSGMSPDDYVCHVTYEILHK